MLFQDALPDKRTRADDFWQLPSPTRVTRFSGCILTLNRAG